MIKILFNYLIRTVIINNRKQHQRHILGINKKDKFNLSKFYCTNWMVFILITLVIQSLRGFDCQKKEMSICDSLSVLYQFE